MRRRLAEARDTLVDHGVADGRLLADLARAEHELARATGYFRRYVGRRLPGAGRLVRAVHEHLGLRDNSPATAARWLDVLRSKLQALRRLALLLDQARNDGPPGPEFWARAWTLSADLGYFNDFKRGMYLAHLIAALPEWHRRSLPEGRGEEWAFADSPPVGVPAWYRSTFASRRLTPWAELTWADRVLQLWAAVLGIHDLANADAQRFLLEWFEHDASWELRGLLDLWMPRLTFTDPPVAGDVAVPGFTDRMIRVLDGPGAATELDTRFEHLVVSTETVLAEPRTPAAQPVRRFDVRLTSRTIGPGVSGGPLAPVGPAARDDLVYGLFHSIDVSGRAYAIKGTAVDAFIRATMLQAHALGPINLGVSAADDIGASAGWVAGTVNSLVRQWWSLPAFDGGAASPAARRWREEIVQDLVWALRDMTLPERVLAMGAIARAAPGLHRAIGDGWDSDDGPQAPRGGASLIFGAPADDVGLTVTAHVVARADVMTSVPADDPDLPQLTGGLGAPEFAEAGSPGIRVVGDLNAQVRDAGGPGDLAVWAAADGWLYMDHRIYVRLLLRGLGAAARRALFTHELLHVRRPDLSEREVHERAPLPDLRPLADSVRATPSVDRRGFHTIADPTAGFVWQAPPLGRSPHPLAARTARLTTTVNGNGVAGTGLLYGARSDLGIFLTVWHLAKRADGGTIKVRLPGPRAPPIFGGIRPRPAPLLLVQYLVAFGAAGVLADDPAGLLVAAQALDVAIVVARHESFRRLSVPSLSFAPAPARAPAALFGYPDASFLVDGWTQPRRTGGAELVVSAGLTASGPAASTRPEHRLDTPVIGIAHNLKGNSGGPSTVVGHGASPSVVTGLQRAATDGRPTVAYSVGGMVLPAFLAASGVL